MPPAACSPKGRPCPRGSYPDTKSGTLVGADGTSGCGDALQRFAQDVLPRASDTPRTSRSLGAQARDGLCVHLRAGLSYSNVVSL